MRMGGVEERGKKAAPHATVRRAPRHSPSHPPPLALFVLPQLVPRRVRWGVAPSPHNTQHTHREQAPRMGVPPPLSSRHGPPLVAR